MLHYTVCVCDILITRYHYFTHCGIYLDTMSNQSFMKTFMSWFVMRVCQGMCSFFQTALRESRWVEQPEGDCGIEAGGVEAWKEQWEPVGLGGFGVSNEKLPEPRGGSAEFDRTRTQVVWRSSQVTWAWRCGDAVCEGPLRLVSSRVTLALHSPVHALHQEWFAPPQKDI